MCEHKTTGLNPQEERPCRAKQQTSYNGRMPQTYAQLHARLAQLKAPNAYEELVEALLTGHPERWVDTAQALAVNDTGKQIVQDGRVGAMWKHVAMNQTLDNTQWARGARALLEALGGGQYSGHALNAMVRTQAAIDEHLRWLPVALAFAQKGGQAGVEAFWHENGVRVLATVMGEDPPENLDIFLAHSQPQQTVGPDGIQTWAELWLGLYVGNVGNMPAERYEQTLLKMAQWGADLEHTSRHNMTLLEVAIDDGISQDMGTARLRQLVDTLITAGADWTRLEEQERAVHVPAMVRKWINQHPRVRHGRLSELTSTDRSSTPRSRM